MSNPIPWHPAVLVRTSAGWFIDEDDRRRWWDGYRWTEHYAPVPVA